MPGLTEVGELTYNGYTFDGATHVAVNVEFVLDDAGRTIIYHKHTLTVTAIITAASGSTTDLTMQEIRERLGHQGRTLRFINKGFGTDLIVNQNSKLRDVVWGPIPKTLSWESVGSANACEVIWQVEVAVPVCDGPATRTDGVMAFNFESTYSIDQHGDTTRTINGYVQIAQTRLGDRRVVETADQYREKITLSELVGFMRTMRQFGTSADKCKLTFTVIDVQIPSENPYPVGVTEIEAMAHVSWIAGDPVRYKGSLDMTVRRRRGVSPSLMWAHFLTLLRQRVLSSKDIGKQAILQSLSCDEEIFGLTTSFSASWTFLSSIKQFLAESGMFKPIGTDWNAWKASVDDVTFNYRGTANLKPSGKENLVDLCGAQPSPPAETGTLPTAQRSQSMNPKNEKPPADQSWLEYKMGTVIDRERPVARQSYLQEPDTDSNTLPMSQGGPPDYGKPGGTDDTLQVGGRSRYTITLAGTAKRAGHKIPRPKLDKVGSQTPVESKGTFAQRIVGNWFGVPIYAAAWQITYAIPNSPGRVNPEDDLKFLVDGTTGNAEQPS